MSMEKARTCVLSVEDAVRCRVVAYGLEGEELRGALEDIIGFCEQWLHDLDESEES